GAPGKLASAFSVGSRVVERMRNGGGDHAGEDDDSRVTTRSDDAGGSDDDAGGPVPIPIQASIEVAVPVAVAYGLSTRFEDYPEFVHRIEAVEEVDDAHMVFVAKLRTGRSEVE